jgi:superkiller protein 3
VYISLGNALTEQQKLGEAVAAYRKAIQLAPGYAGSYYNLGILLGQKQDFNEAKTAYLKALSLPDVIVSTKSTHSSAYNNLGIIYLRQGQIEQAVAQFKKSLAIDANNKNALRNLDEAMRQLSLKQGQGQEVVGSTTEYLERNPISEIKRSIVLIQPEFQYSGFGKGTGYVIRRDGNRAWILTNRHVIVDSEGNKPAIKVRLELFYGNLPEGKLAPRLPATIEKFTSVKDAQDLAILRVDNLPGDIQPLLFSDQVPSKDSRITIIGHPGRNRWLQLDRSLLKISKSDDLLIDSSIEEGASGSPVLNSVKQVIGIVYETDSMGGRNDFVVAHRVNSIKHIMQQWGISAP